MENEEFVIDWSTIAELDKEELVQLLKSAENELRRKIKKITLRDQ